MIIMGELITVIVFMLLTIVLFFTFGKFTISKSDSIG